MHRGGRLLIVTLVAALPVGVISSCSRETKVHVTHDVTYGNAGGVALTGDVYEPSDHATGDGNPEVLPVIVVIHGGAWTQGDKADVTGTAQGLAKAGFVAVAINYAIRSAGQRFPGESEDCQQAVRWVQEHAAELGIDPQRVGVYGSSAGGNLAMMVGVLGNGSSTLPPVKAVVAWSGISDLSILAPPDGRSHPENPPPGCLGRTDCIGVVTPQVFPDYLGCTLSRCRERYVAASPVNFVSASTPPMYLSAAEIDFVPFDQSERMAEALQRNGVEAEAVAVPGRGHAEQLRDHALEPTIDFFRSHLR